MFIVSKAMLAVEGTEHGGAATAHVTRQPRYTSAKMSANAHSQLHGCPKPLPHLGSLQTVVQEHMLLVHSQLAAGADKLLMLMACSAAQISPPRPDTMQSRVCWQLFLRPERD